MVYRQAGDRPCVPPGWGSPIVEAGLISLWARRGQAAASDLYSKILNILYFVNYWCPDTLEEKAEQGLFRSDETIVYSI